MRVRFWGVLFLVCLAATFGAAGDARCQQTETNRFEDDQVLLRADTITHDRDNEIITAEGNVEIARGDRLLTAERVVYETKSDVLRAEGNVTVLEPSGEVMFADEVELHDGLKKGFVIGIRTLFKDDSRIAANVAERTDDDRTVMAKAVFSPCKICADSPGRPPLWQVKAVRVIHNKTAQRVDYKDAFLEVYGIPVFYVPLFSHPDPTVERQSGLLAPTIKSASDLGLVYKQPYFWAIADDRDMTISPMVTSNEGVALAVEYRQRFRPGLLVVDSSGTYVDKRDENGNPVPGRQFRGHLKLDTDMEVDENLHAGANLFVTTDDTYLRLYDFSSQTILTNRLYAEGFYGRNYFGANAYAFQSLEQEDDASNIPVIAPWLEYDYIGEPGGFGQYWTANSELAVITRGEGTDSRRLTVGGAWQVPWIDPVGGIYKVSAAVDGDLYWVNDAPNQSLAGDTVDGFAGRINPSLTLDWRWPWVRSSGGIRQLIEPIAQAIVSPNHGNPDKIPNEDSLSFEFDETNLFAANRFPGRDRLEGGPRVNYGLKLGAYGSEGRYANLLIGQSYRSHVEPGFAGATGLEENFSDLVGRIDVVPHPYINYAQRVRLSRESLSLERNEITLSAGPSRFRVNASYTMLSDELAADDLGSREEILLGSRVHLFDGWSLSAGHRHDLTGRTGSLNTNFGIYYLDECLDFSVVFNRTFTHDREIRPTTSITFRVRLVNLG